MKFNKREMEVLDFAAGKRANLTHLAKALGMKKSNLTIYVKKLMRYQLVVLTKSGRNKELALGNGILAGFAALKPGFPALRLSDILTGKNPFLLSFMKDRQPLRISELDMPAITAKRLLGKLRNLGLVSMPQKGLYRLRGEAGIVGDFCRNMLVQLYFAEASGELGPLEYGVYSFDSAKELGAIFATSGELGPKNYWPTAYTIAHQYGLGLIQAGRHYYANAKPDLGDVIIHTLAISKDARGINYASFLVLKNKYNPRLLLKKRHTFGLGREYLANFVEFIETRGEKPFGGLESLKEAEEMLDGKL